VAFAGVVILLTDHLVMPAAAGLLTPLYLVAAPAA
jgi:hypothetical protein